MLALIFVIKNLLFNNRDSFSKSLFFLHNSNDTLNMYNITKLIQWQKGSKKTHFPLLRNQHNVCEIILWNNNQAENNL